MSVCVQSPNACVCAVRGDISFESCQQMISFQELVQKVEGYMQQRTEK